MSKFIERAKMLMARLDAFDGMYPKNVGLGMETIAMYIYAEESVEDYQECVRETQSLLFAFDCPHLYQASIKTDSPSPSLLHSLLRNLIEIEELRTQHDG